MAERVETLVVGGGQAGLAVGYELARRGADFVILDASAEVGRPWRRRWDSLRLFTPARYSALPGAPLAPPGWRYPGKDELAEYLSMYAARFELPVRNGIRVTGVRRADGPNGFEVTTEVGGDYLADSVVVAVGQSTRPRVPRLADALDPAIHQMHSSDYRRPDQLQDGDVLVVGAGNSGAEIALELARSRRTVLSGRGVGRLPRYGKLLSWLVPHYLLTRGNRVGRRFADRIGRTGTPWMRVSEGDFAEAGIERVPRTVGVHDGLPRLDDGMRVEVSTVIWCTGFEPDFSWLDLVDRDERGLPRHERGIVPDLPGLYFVGLPFQYSLTSGLIGGVGRDAKYVVDRLTKDMECEMPRHAASHTPGGG